MTNNLDYKNELQYKINEITGQINSLRIIMNRPDTSYETKQKIKNKIIDLIRYKQNISFIMGDIIKLKKEINKLYSENEDRSKKLQDNISYSRRILHNHYIKENTKNINKINNKIYNMIDKVIKWKK